MIEPTPEILRGHIDECFRHYADAILKKAPKGSKEAPESKRKLAEFCGVTISTVTTWFTLSSLPKGETLIRLFCFLDTLGYRVIELERVEHRPFVELIGFKILSINEAIALTGYSDSNKLLRVFWAECKASKERSAIMWDVGKHRREDLLAAKYALREAILEPRLPEPPREGPTNSELIEQLTEAMTVLNQCLTRIGNVTPSAALTDIVPSALVLCGRLTQTAVNILGQPGESDSP